MKLKLAEYIPKDTILVEVLKLLDKIVETL